MELLESVGPRPRQARYQAALRPDMKCSVNSRVLSCIPAIPIGPFAPFKPRHLGEKGCGPGCDLLPDSFTREFYNPSLNRDPVLVRCELRPQNSRPNSLRRRRT